MEEYIQNYKLFDKTVVYNFELGNGGIGDYIKFFMFVLEDCMKNNKKLYCKKNNIEIEKYIKLKYDMYIENLDNNYEVVAPYMYYSIIDTNFKLKINEVFYFTDEIIENSKRLFQQDQNDQNDQDQYVSIHLRLGDKYLETDPKYVMVKDDTRNYSEEKIYEMIEKETRPFFCCDNQNYKLKIKNRYPNIIITNCKIGHTSLSNTTNEQIIDAITEFYKLTNSQIIYSASNSGFSEIASKFNNIPLIKLHS
jgi:hypothetical protein